MLNSYSNFLSFASKQGNVGGFLQALAAGTPGWEAAAPVSASGEEVVRENEVREIAGRAAWPNDSLRKLFVAVQDKMPAIYESKQSGDAPAFTLAGGADIRPLLLKAKAVLVVVAPLTPIKTDDVAVQLIDVILGDFDLLGWFKAKVDAPPMPTVPPAGGGGGSGAGGVGTLNLEAEPENVQMALKARNIDWSQVATAVTTIVQLVRLLRG